MVKVHRDACATKSRERKLPYVYLESDSSTGQDQPVGVGV